MFPDKPVARNYKTKETTVNSFLQEKFPDVTWKCDKRVEDGCSKRRPDFLLDMGSHVVIVEIDENSHGAYNPTCEEKRMGEIWEDLGHRSLVFVQFTPDRYKDEHGRNIL